MCGLGYMDPGGEVGSKLELLKSTEKSLLSEGRYFWHNVIPVKFYCYFQRVATFGGWLLWKPVTVSHRLSKRQSLSAKTLCRTTLL